MKLKLIVLISMMAIGSQVANADLLYQASLSNGDYGAGDQIGISPVGCPQTSVCAPAPTGIVETPEGAQYVGPEAMVNFPLAADFPASVNSFRTQGTVSIRVFADSASFDSGSLIEDNYGYNAFRGGQSYFGSSLSSGGSDVSIGWSLWISNVWYPVSTPPTFSFDEWHHIGLAWGGPDNDMEVCIDGQLAYAGDLPGGISFPWGTSSSANFGIGTNHERGFNVPASLNAATGVTYADIQVWDEYVASCATQAPTPTPTVPAKPVPTFGVWGLGLLGLLLAVLARRRLQ